LIERDDSMGALRPGLGDARGEARQMRIFPVKFHSHKFMRALRQIRTNCAQHCMLTAGSLSQRRGIGAIRKRMKARHVVTNLFVTLSSSDE
jgi:hypothetical protein